MWGEELRERVKVLDSTREMEFSQLDNKYRALSADADTAEGLRIYGMIFDELHVQKNRRLWRSLVYGMAAEAATDEPLMIIITTAGVYDQESIGMEQHDYARAILAGTVTDPTEYALVYAAEDSDDWTDPEVWRKANPSMGITISMDEMAASCEQAKLSPVAESEFRRYRLDQWVQVTDRYLDLTLWARAKRAPAPDLARRRCWGGLDLGLTRDLSAFVLVFEPTGEDEPYWIKRWTWAHRAAVELAARKGNGLFLGWERQGLLTVHEGDAVDYGLIAADIERLAGEYAIQEIAYDQWNAAQMGQTLMNHSINVIDFKQWGAHFNGPMRELPKMLAAGQLAHNGDPVLAWAAGNLVARQDPSTGYIRPVKEHKDSKKRIDPLVALLMALARALAHQTNQTESIYENRDIFML